MKNIFRNLKPYSQNQQNFSGLHYFLKLLHPITGVECITACLIAISFSYNIYDQLSVIKIFSVQLFLAELYKVNRKVFLVFCFLKSHSCRKKIHETYIQERYLKIIWTAWNLVRSNQIQFKKFFYSFFFFKISYFFLFLKLSSSRKQKNWENCMFCSILLYPSVDWLNRFSDTSTWSPGQVEGILTGRPKAIMRKKKEEGQE